MNRKHPAEGRFPARESRGPPRNVQNFTNGPVSPELVKKIMIAKDLIERCLQLYMNKKRVIRTVFEQVGIEPNVTSGVWDQMTRENAEFFEEYYKKLILIDQIEAFNRLVERQCHLQNLASQKASLAPFREGNQHMPVDSRLQFPSSSSGHLQRSTVSSNDSEDAASNSSYLAHMNNGGGMALDSNAADRTPYFGNRNLTETSYSGAKDRHSLSTSSLPPPVEPQWQDFIEPQWQHFIEQQGFDWSSARKIYELTGAHENPASTTLIGSQESSSCSISNYHNGNPALGSFHPAQMNYERGMATYENEAPPFQIPSPVSVGRHLKEYDFILSRDPFSSSSLAPPIEKQGQPSTQQQGQHFMEQQGTGSSFHPAQMNYERGMATYENEAPPFQIPSPVSVERHLKEYDFILSRDPFSSSSLAPLIEKQGQPSTQQQGQHFMEQQGTGSSVQGEKVQLLLH
ncbi:hypothetical protein POPTR_015G014550v4 [Populus trichocarpa]|uniref:Uncharacterized protein n=1 Tax=Populus trichocarpa TaxID=3694 RepID=A0ACC0RWL2_POPTR|nr:hypothetical protein BDE02_15G013000 [Populus trichocarpa]KAI9380856.1 hypothetical protein POPTR_015G014550v4 [Populus trichocarpa]